MPNNLTVYTVAHNEAHMIPYWIRHYQQFADEIIIYDDWSTDGTDKVAKALGAKVRPYPHRGLDDIHLAEFANDVLMDERHLTTWAIWADADEFVYHRELNDLLLGYLESGITIAACVGYQMVAAAPPLHDGQIYDKDDYRQGFLFGAFDKPAIVRPSKLTAINWGGGKHFAKPSGNVVWANEKPLMLHYRMLGADYWLARDKRNSDRMTERSRNAGLGWQVTPEYSPKLVAEQWPRVWEKRERVI